MKFPVLEGTCLVYSVMSREEYYDVAVVGAGIMGSWTAVHLAERGMKTVLLEQVTF